MTSKLEEAAKAHYESSPGRSWATASPARQYLEIEAMRAALEVLREPDKAMLNEIWNQNRSLSRGQIERNWRAGIDAILQEGE